MRYELMHKKYDVKTVIHTVNVIVNDPFVKSSKNHDVIIYELNVSYNLWRNNRKYTNYGFMCRIVDIMNRHKSFILFDTDCGIVNCLDD